MHKSVMRIIAVSASIFLLTSVGASAKIMQNRTYSVTDFDSVRIVGSFIVDVKTGKSPGVKATGSAEAIERLVVTQIGSTLVIKPNSQAWGGWPGAGAGPTKIAISVPKLGSINVDGPGVVTVDRMTGLRINLSASGTSSLGVAAIDADNLNIVLKGSAVGQFRGVARKAIGVGRGAVTLNAPSLSVTDLQLSWHSAGNADIIAVRTAKLISNGSGNVTVGGKASCQMSALGSGTVSCAGKRADQ